eukprot:4291784-Pyramimonas_sp.AAC.1
MAVLAKCQHHPGGMDRFCNIDMVAEVQMSLNPILDGLSQKWSDNLQTLVALIKGNLIDWESRGEQLLKPDAKDLVRQILQNTGYKELTPLATSAMQLVKLNRDVE